MTLAWASAGESTFLSCGKNFARSPRPAQRSPSLRELNAAGGVTMRRVCTNGTCGGKPWKKGAIYEVLASRLYWRAVHKGVA